MFEWDAAKSEANRKERGIHGKVFGGTGAP
jgi:uncharacterized DUF497 family protein